MASPAVPLKPSVLACCLCGPARQKLSDYGQVDGYRLNRCACGMVFLAEEPVNPVNEWFLEDARTGHAIFSSFPEIYARYRPVFDGFFQERLDRIRQSVPLKDLLDIGCGYGLFLAFCRERGVRAVGVDLSLEACRHAAKTGLPVARADCNLMWIRKRFDAIVMCDVLEHSRDPARLLASCREWLVPGGAIYIQVPNVLGDTLPEKKVFNLPYHLWQYSPDTLARLLGSVGYRVVDYWTGVMGVINAYEKGGPDDRTLMMWETARVERRGNRLQMLAISP